MGAYCLLAFCARLFTLLKMTLISSATAGVVAPAATAINTVILENELVAQWALQDSRSTVIRESRKFSSGVGAASSRAR